MRIWSLHPSYLDAKGLVACWRETLLAQKVLRGATRGYRNHPQLHRFRAHANPPAAIGAYLWGLHAEATRRGYQFDATRIETDVAVNHLVVTDGQLAYEAQHLRAKLLVRDSVRAQLLPAKNWLPHPLFVVVPGDVAPWELR